MNAELKPCPFCGGTYIKISTSDCLLVKDFVYARGSVYIGCPKCGAIIGFWNPKENGGKIGAKEKAIKAWNRRADDEEEG